jgi:hypothetical protein
MWKILETRLRMNISSLCVSWSYRQFLYWPLRLPDLALMDFCLCEFIKDTIQGLHHNTPTHYCCMLLIFYEHISGPEGSSEPRGTDFTYSLLDSYVTPQINEGPGFCRCKRGPVVNIYLLLLQETWSKTCITEVYIKVTRLEFSWKFTFMCNLSECTENGFSKDPLFWILNCLILKYNITEF